MVLTRTRRAVAALGGATVVAAAALVAASVIGPAGATGGSGSGPMEGPGGRGPGQAHGFGFMGGSDSMRSCAADAGIDAPMGPGAQRPELTQAQRDALQSCLEKEWAARHDELAKCVGEQGATFPDMPAGPGADRPELTQEQRDALRACGEELGGMPFGPGSGMPFGPYGGHPGGARGDGMMQPCDPGSHDTSGRHGTETTPSTAASTFWEA